MSAAEVLQHRGILDAWVEPVLGCTNEPELHVRSDHLPDAGSANFRYRAFPVQSGVLWWAHDASGWVRFLLEDPKNQQGYGGHAFTIHTADGLRTVRGPWSSRAGVANSVAPVECVEVIVHPEGDSLAYHGLSLTVGTAAMALKQFAPRWMLYPVYYGDDRGRLPRERDWALRWFPPGETRDVAEAHEDFEQWKDLMGAMRYGANRWLA